jgi:hypothetical protein
VTPAVIAISVAFVAVYGISAYAVFTFFWEREKRNAEERRELIDRITIPEAAQAAAFHRALDDHDEHIDMDAEDDEKFGRVISDDFDFLTFGDN